MEAFSAASGVYQFGHNAVTTDDSISLKKLAISGTRSIVAEQFGLYTSFFNNDAVYADTLITKAFSRDTPFVEASDDQISEIIVRALQTMVMYMYSLEKFHDAAHLCGLGETNESIMSWEEGVAALVGSIEGPDLGGRPNGQLMFALSKQLCSQFSTCQKTNSGSRSSKANEIIINFLKQGALDISEGDCGDVHDSLTYSLERMLKASLIQGTLHFAAVNAVPQMRVGSLAGSVASGHVMANSIVPLIPDIHKAEADLIMSNMNFELKWKPVPDGAAAVFQAMAYSLQGLQVDCEDVGVYAGIKNGDICLLSVSKLSTPVEPTPRPPTPSDTEPDFPPPNLDYTFTSNADDQ